MKNKITIELQENGLSTFFAFEDFVKQYCEINKDVCKFDITSRIAQIALGKLAESSFKQNFLEELHHILSRTLGNYMCDEFMNETQSNQLYQDMTEFLMRALNLAFNMYLNQKYEMEVRLAAEEQEKVNQDV